MPQEYPTTTDVEVRMTPDEIGRIEGKLIELLERVASVETALSTLTDLRGEGNCEERRYREALEERCRQRHARDRQRLKDLEQVDKRLMGFSNKLIGGLLFLTLGLSTVAAALSIVQFIGG